MKWIRGKYNNQRIAGFEIKLSVYLFRWYWMPILEWKFQKSIHWLCFHIWIGATYEV